VAGCAVPSTRTVGTAVTSTRTVGTAVPSTRTVGTAATRRDADLIVSGSGWGAYCSREWLGRLLFPDGCEGCPTRSPGWGFCLGDRPSFPCFFRLLFSCSQLSKLSKLSKLTISSVSFPKGHGLHRELATHVLCNRTCV